VIRVGGNILGQDAGVSDFESRHAVDVQILVQHAQLLAGSHLDGADGVPRGVDVLPEELCEDCVVFGGVLEVLDGANTVRVGVVCYEARVELHASCF